MKYPTPNPQHALFDLDNLPLNQDLFIIYGNHCMPRIIRAQLRKDAMGQVAIWGHSIYRRNSGFRTLGRWFKKWAHEEPKKEIIYVFADVEHALGYLRELLTLPIHGF